MKQQEAKMESGFFTSAKLRWPTALLVYSRAASRYYPEATVAGASPELSTGRLLEAHCSPPCPAQVPKTALTLLTYLHRAEADP